MDAAYQVFANLGEPSGVEEDWRYVDFASDSTTWPWRPSRAPRWSLARSSRRFPTGQVTSVS
jgi:hypothetical protein